MNPSEFASLKALIETKFKALGDKVEKLSEAAHQAADRALQLAPRLGQAEDEIERLKVRVTALELRQETVVVGEEEEEG